MTITPELLTVIAAVLAAFSGLYFPARFNRKEQERRNMEIERWRTQKEKEVEFMQKELERLNQELEKARHDGQDDRNLILVEMKKMKEESTEQHRELRNLLSERTKRLYERLENFSKELHETNENLNYLKGRINAEGEKK